MGSAPQQRFGRFTVIDLLGAGGMGEVFRARDDLLGREVAIKTLCIPGLPAAAAEEFKARFLNEARAIASLSHPHVVRVFDLGFEGATPYLVMEVVGGASLAAQLKRGRRLTYAEVRALGIQIGGALGAAHAQGILHRDVKPGNVLEAEPGMWKLADFGVARVPDSSLTMTGQFLGSPAYAAPEALLLGQFSSAGDVYGLGATLYEALAGESPYGAAAQVSLAAVARVAEVPPVAARCPAVPADLARVITAALARDPGARPTAIRLVEALAGAATPPGAAVAAAAPRAGAGRGGADATQAAAPRALAAAAGASRAEVAALGTAATVAVPSLVGGAPAAPPSAVARAATVAVPSLVAAVAPPPTAVAPAASPRRGRTGLVLGLAAAAVLLVAGGVGLGLALSGGGPPAPAAAASPVRTPDAGRAAAPPLRPADAAARDAALSPEEAARLRRQQWQHIQLLLARGEIEPARRELEEYAKRNPDDDRAPQLLEYLRAMGGGEWREEQE
jgi:serine/threonine-protein kinase